MLLIGLGVSREAIVIVFPLFEFLPHWNMVFNAASRFALRFPTPRVLFLTAFIAQKYSVSVGSEKVEAVT